MNIGVLRGGPSPHYLASLKSGAHVINTLRERHVVRDIFIDRSGTWHLEGLPTKPSKLVGHIDLFWNALHGDYGEDGNLQRELDNFGIRYTGSDATASRFSFRKDLAKNFLRQAGIQVPEAISVKRGADVSGIIRTIFSVIGGQSVVKPVSGAHSRGVFFIPTITDLEWTLRVMLEEFEHVLVEEAIHGKELKCLVAKNFRGQDLYAFIPVEVNKRKSIGVHKVGLGGDQLIVPARLGREQKDIVMATAKRAHEALSLGDYSIVDMILTPRRLVVLEVDALPLLGEDSVVAQSLQSVGASPREFYENFIK